ncbi:MAG: enoyl-CoA hydratase/isomerase family protein [Pseudomonadota bacterium]|nr:enoyl-CoA hydratase/isomerase family protein [Pseudomonadota bacterium]
MEDRNVRALGRSGCVTVEQRGALAIVRFARAESRANPLSAAVMRDLIEAARSFDDDARTGAIVVTGRPETFSAGLDLRDPETAELTSADLDRRRVLADAGRRLLEALSGLAPVTVAAIEGPCLGGGLALAATLDFRVASGNALFGAPEVAVGLSMGWGSLAHLSAVAGVQATRRLVLAGERLTAEQALAAGLVDRIAEEGGALEAACEFARRVAALPLAPLRMAKRAIAAIVQAGGAATALDVDQFVAAAGSEQFSETLGTFAKQS